MTPALQVRDVHVRYREVVALEGADLVLEAGRVCGLVGVNGSGKSSLLRAVMGMVRPVAGSVLIAGRDPAAARREGLVAYVPQAEAIDHDFPVSVRDVVSMGLYGRLGPMRRLRPQHRAEVAAAIDRVDLGALADRQVGQLSGGQRKRAFVARGLVQGASLLLLDEPFAGVDVTSQATMTAVLRELAAAGTAVLVATHDLGGLEELCDEAVLLNRRVLLHAPPAEVLRPENLARVFPGAAA